MAVPISFSLLFAFMGDGWKNEIRPTLTGNRIPNI